MVTRRELKAMLKGFRDPPPMTLEQALASERPVHEIGIRIMGDFEQLTEQEKLFWAANYFMSDTLNGGLHQTLSNDTGFWTEAVAAFARAYCTPELGRIFSELQALFPAGKVPESREERNALLDQMESDGRQKRLDELTTKLCECEPQFNQGLLRFVSENADAFLGLSRAE